MIPFLHNVDIANYQVSCFRPPNCKVSLFFPDNGKWAGADLAGGAKVLTTLRDVPIVDYRLLLSGGDFFLTGPLVCEMRLRILHQPTVTAWQE